MCVITRHANTEIFGQYSILTNILGWTATKDPMSLKKVEQADNNHVTLNALFSSSLFTPRTSWLCAMNGRTMSMRVDQLIHCCYHDLPPCYKSKRYTLIKLMEKPNPCHTVKVNHSVKIDPKIARHYKWLPRKKIVRRMHYTLKEGITVDMVLLLKIY